MCMPHMMDHGSNHGSDDELRHQVETLRLRVEKLETEVELLRQLLMEKSRGDGHDH